MHYIKWYLLLSDQGDMDFIITACSIVTFGPNRDLEATFFDAPIAKELTGRF